MSANPVLEEFPVEAMEEIDIVAKEWIQAQSDKEVKRIRDVGSSVLPLKVKLYMYSCGVTAINSGLI